MKTKQLYAIVWYVCSCLLWFFPNTGYSSSMVDGLFYELNTSNNTAEIVGLNRFSSGGGFIVIPQTIVYNETTYRVTSIGNYAFSEWNNEGPLEEELCIYSVTIPNSVTSIGAGAFQGCKFLTELNIPRSVTSIGNKAFSGCGLTSITVDPLNPKYDSDVNANAIIETETATLVVGCMNTQIPDYVQTIGEGAFYFCSGLSSLFIPLSVTSIGGEAFYGCDGLTSIIVDDQNTKYVSDDFNGNNINAIIESESGTLIVGCMNTVIPDNYQVYSIGEGAFYGCTYLNSIIIPNSVSSIGDNAFYRCFNLNTLFLPNSITQIGDNAFQYCESLISLEIPEHIYYIGDNAFSYCSSLNSLIIPVRNHFMGTDVFHCCNGLCSITMKSRTPNILCWDEESGNWPLPDAIKSTCTLYVPYGSRQAYENAYYWRDFDNIEELDYIAKGVCGDNLTFIVNPDMSMVISGTGDMWDYGEGWNFNEACFVLVENVIVEEGVSSIGDYAFCDYRSLNSISLPNSLTSIGYYAFLGCNNLTALSIPRNVTNIGTGLMGMPILTSDKLSSITVDPNNPVYDSRDNCNAIIRTSDNILVLGCKNTVIPNSVKEIGHKSFRLCEGLTSIAIPNSVTTIDWYAFSGCTSLTSVTIPSSVKVIYEHAFADTPWYNNQPDGLIYINDVAYRYKGTMPEGTNIIIQEGTTSISGNAFYNCTNLVSLEIPNSVSIISNSAFEGCSSLSAITMKNNTPPIIDCNGGASYLPGQKKLYGFNLSTCTLYVPYGSKSAYENAEYWNEFENIVEYDSEPDTDISSLDNAIYVEQVEGRVGATLDIPVCLKSSYDVRAFQFTMQVPQGIIITGWTLGDKRLSPEVPTTSHYTISEDKTSIFVGCSLNDISNVFSERDGEIGTVCVTLDETMEAGSYPIYLTACTSTYLDENVIKDEDLENVKSTLIVEDYMIGDANGDGKLRIGDATTILIYLSGTELSNFNEKAADANGDGKLRIGDVTAVMYMLEGQY